MRKLKNYLISALVVIPLLIISAPFRTQPTETKAALYSRGYDSIEVSHGFAWFECPSGYLFATEFDATDPFGNRVSGCMCSGSFRERAILFY